jgi:hypothetical protein
MNATSKSQVSLSLSNMYTLEQELLNLRTLAYQPVHSHGLDICLLSYSTHIQN